MPHHRILIIDDEKQVLESWQRTLKFDGHSVSTARTADQALRECDEHSFDLVVVDFIMPSMNGVELLRRIRKKLPLIRSIVISGKIDKGVSAPDITKSLQESVEADLYLHKPVSNNHLLASIRELLTNPVSEKNWDEIAKKAVAARIATIQSAKEASKNLRKLVRQTKKKR